MRIHIVAERELRAAARRKATYWVRCLTGISAFVVLIWLMWATNALRRGGGAHDAFVAFAFIAFSYCILMGAIRTADCVSSERREGTLGLLFLTNLNSAEIMTGKLLSNALPTIYGLLAIFPMLALPLLMGGVTLSEFLCTMLALLVAIGFSLGCGMLASVLCRRQFPAVALAMGLVIALGTATFLAAAVLEEYRRGHWLVQVLASTSPLYALSAGLEGKIFRANHYWEAIATVLGISAFLLGLATWLLARSWRDRAKSTRTVKAGASAPAAAKVKSPNWRRDARRKRQLTLNPFYWLAARRQAGVPIFLLIIAALVVVTVTGTTPLFSKISSPARLGSALGEMFAWLCAAGALHVMMLYYAALLGAQSFAEDKQAGALELVFSTPARVHTLLQGAGMAWRRRMLVPAIAVSVTHAYAFWKIMAVALIEPPGNVMITVGTTQWDMLMAALFNIPINGRRLEWMFVFIMRVIAMVLPVAFALWFALGRIGRWLGLRMKHPGFAPLLALALVVVPSTLGITLMTIIAEEARFFRYSDRIVAPVITGLSFLIMLANCALAAGWASRNLRNNFRSVVIGRFDRAHRSWISILRSLVVMGAKAVATVVTVSLLIALFYWWQNFHSHHAWNAFELKLKQQNISLDLAAVQPPSVPANDNFANAPAFMELTSGGNPALTSLLNPVNQLTLLRWRNQQHLPLANFVGVLGISKSTKQSGQNYTPYNETQLPDIPNSYAGSTNNADVAPLVLNRLEPYRADLQELAVAAQRPYYRPVSNVTAQAILQADGREIALMRQLHLIYTLKALALLHTPQTNGAAADDVVTGLRLSRLAGQSMHPSASGHAQAMLLTTLQPLWEGLESHQWSDADLLRFQTELAAIDPTADFTLGIQCAVRANIEIWKTLPNQSSSQWSIPDGGGYSYTDEWQGMHRGWWFDCCIDVYTLGQDAIANVTPQRTNLPVPLDWGAVNSLPLNTQSEQLFRRLVTYWGDANSQNVFFGQTSLNQARIAVALERLRVAHQNHATNLNQLLPEFLATIPIDPIRCRPLIFEPGTKGNYILRGVGPNVQNDRTNSSSDDWIWAYPTNASTTPPSP
jgi:ABC-type transport system involved in multi-copper enzyme maturation permease subunit